MIRRAIRLIFRILGWLISPLVLTAAAIGGSAIGFLIVASWAPMTGFIFALACGLAGALVGALLWTRMLRGSRRLREALAVTGSGLPESEVVHDLLQAVSLEDKPPP